MTTNPYLDPIDHWRAWRDAKIAHFRRRLAAWIRRHLHTPDDPTEG